MAARTGGFSLAFFASLVLVWYWSDSTSDDSLSDTGPPARSGESAYFEQDNGIGVEAAGDLSGAHGRSKSQSPPARPAHEGGGDHGHARVEDPTGDLVLYERSPMSLVPHRVMRGWGARGAGAVPGVVGAYVVVDPGIADAEIAELAQDIREYHFDANALSVRILDSQRAATYDRHDDGGEFAEAHLLGTVNKNTNLGIDRIEIRGKQIDPHH